MKTLIALLALALVACGGAPFESSGTDAVSAGSPDVSEAGAFVSGGGPSVSSAGSSGSASAGSEARGGGAGAPEGGSPSTAGAGGSASPAGAAGSTGAPMSMAGSAGVSGCLLDRPTACSGHACGTVPDGCGGQYECGYQLCPSVSGTTQTCVSTDSGSSCRVTCADLGAECGDYPAYGLSCGGCTAQAGGDCGLTQAGLCSYCSDQGPAPTSATCGNGQLHVWGMCREAPQPSCKAALGASGQPLPNQWCC